MPVINVNLADVESFEPLPEGKYAAEIEKVEVRSNKARDGLYLNWELTVLDGDYENRKLWMITSLKETALFRLKEVFEQLDLLDDDEDMELEYDDDMEPDTTAGPLLLYPEVEGIECTAVVKNEMYDGRERNRVDQLLGDTPRRKKKKTTARKTSRKSEPPARKSRDTGRRTSRYDEDEDEDDEEEEVRPRRRSSNGSSSQRSSARRRVR